MTGAGGDSQRKQAGPDYGMSGTGHTGEEPPAIAVLYVDDERSLLEPMKLTLEKHGHMQVETTTSAQDALDRISTRPFDVIVSDYQMPEINGIQFLRRLRGNGNTIPFILFTGKGREDAVIEAYDAGADFYLAKGGDPKAMFLDLTHKIREVVTRRRAEKALRESEERYRKVMEQSHDAIFIIRGSRFVFVNDRVSEISGYTKEELYDKEIWDLLHPEDRARVMENARSRLSGGPAPQTYEARVFTRDGEVRYLEFAVTTVTFGGETASLSSVRDITERKRAEDSLRRSEEKYRSIFTTFDDLYYQTDMHGIITVLSPSCKKITGWEPEELIGLQVLDLYPFPEQRKLLLNEMFTNGAVHDFEVTLRNKQGDHLSVSVTSHVVYDESGKPVALEGSLRDITERRRVEDALHASEERFRTLADFLPVMIFEMDREGKITFANRLAYPTFGAEPADVVAGVNMMDYVAPEERPKVTAALQALVRGETRRPAEYTLLRKDGSRFPAMIRTSVILDKSGTLTGYRGVIIDLTERKQQEAALRQSEESYRGLFNAVKDAIVILDRDAHVLDANRGAEEMFGRPPGSLTGDIIGELAAAGRNDPAALKELVSQAFREGTREFEFWARRRTGDEFLTEVRLYRTTYFGKEAVIGLAVDITERRRAENALRESEELFRTLFNNANDAIFLHEMLPGGSPGRYVMVNDIACSRLGYTREELLERSPPDIVAPGHVPVMAAISRTIRQRGHATFDAIHRRKDGTEFPVEISAHLFELRGRLLSLSIARDMTERRKMESELRASEQYLKTIFQSAQTGLLIIDPATRSITDANPAAARLIGADRQAIIGTSCDTYACYPARSGTTVPAGEVENAEGILVKANGRKIPILRTVVPVAISDRHYLLESIMDITDRKRAEDALQSAYLELEQKVRERTRELSELTSNLQNEILERNRVLDALAASEEKYRSLVERIQDIVFRVNRDGVITYLSPHVLSRMGISGDMPKISVFEIVPPEFHERLREYIAPAPNPRPVISGLELRLPLPRLGRTAILDVNASPVYDRDGAFDGYSGIARDITERTALQNQIASSLREKETLLKEIHHRVKNNMQVISSLLSLQAKMVKDVKSREIILESQNRVMSIALVHEMLYRSENLSRIRYADYLRKMTDTLLQSYGIPPGKVTVEIQAEDIVIPISKAIPVSLIVNELISNSLKYAFPKDRKGRILVRLSREGEQFSLVVGDDGVGLPDSFDMEHAETLGLQLVKSLAGQLAGTVALNRKNGTEFSIAFAIGQAAGEPYG